MSLLEEDEAQDNADAKQKSANEVGKKVGEALKDATLGEDTRPRGVGVCEGPTDARSDDGTNAPDKGHDRVRASWKLLAKGHTYDVWSNLRSCSGLVTSSPTIV